ncbi:MAG: hypothetical protein WC819_00895 [Parcubacteria group bacterium]
MNTKNWYNLIAFILLAIVFILYQANIFSIKGDFFSNMLFIVIVSVVLLPLVSELSILNVLKIKKDIESLRHETIEKFASLQNTIISTVNQQQSVQVITHPFDKKEVEELKKYLDDKTKGVTIDKKVKTEKDEEIIPDLSRYLYKFFLNYKKIQENLNELSLASKNDELRNRSVLNQSRNLFKSGIIDKELYLAIQYFSQKRGEIFHGRELTKEDIKEGNKISEKIIILLDELLYDKHIGVYFVEK